MTYASVILADAPVAFWPLTESGTSIGSVYADASGHGYDVTVTTGTLGHTAGPIAGTTAPRFPTTPNYDGLLGAVTLGLPVDGQPYTLEGWIKPERANYWMAWIAYGPKGASAPFIGSDMHMGTGHYLEFWDPANSSSFFLSSSLDDGAWHYVALTDNAAGTQKYYVDGVLVDTQTGGLASNGLVYHSTNVLAIGDPGVVGGVAVSPAQEEYTGGLAQIAIYPYVLSAAQVAAHYAAAGAAPTPALRGGRGRIIQ